MTVERAIRLLAGTMILISLALVLISPWFLLLTAFVAVNLIQSAFTGFCPPERLLRRLGLSDAPSCGCSSESPCDPS